MKKFRIIEKKLSGTILKKDELLRIRGGDDTTPPIISPE